MKMDNSPGWAKQCVLCVLLVLFQYSLAAISDTAECKTYSCKLSSLPDVEHMTAYKERRHKDFVIDDVKSTNIERSYYWCELDFKESENEFKRYRHFGFNATHWWVEKGCGGWFVITECKAADQTSLLKKLSTGGSVPQGDSSGSSNTDTAAQTGSPSSLGTLYDNWPKIGYHFPTSSDMWDMLDRATYVDVPEQLGYYQRHRKTRSAAFDSIVH